jgi:protein-tyrosine phosphatase
MVPVIRVCFVCLGNICRSPAAEGVMRHLVREAGLEAAIEVDSAGTAGYHAGDAPDARARAAGRRRGIEISGRARQVTRADFERFDYILVMDDENLSNLRSLAPAKPKAEYGLLRAFDPTSPPGASVPDPYYGGEQGFDDVLDQCIRACSGLLERIRREHGL